MARKAAVFGDSCPLVLNRDLVQVREMFRRRSRRHQEAVGREGSGGESMRFEHRAVPIVLAAVLIDTIGFGIVMPVFPHLITSIGHVDLEQATRIAGYMLVVFA